MPNSATNLPLPECSGSIMGRDKGCIGAAVLWICLLWLPLGAEELRFETARQWRRWTLPNGIVELSPEGSVRPVAARKGSNAALDAAAFGGAIRGAGSNKSTAGLVMDGDRTTGWRPDPKDAPESWWLEIDLGRAVSARQVRLVFAEDTPPFPLFDLLLSTGEQARDNTRSPIPGTLIYRLRERFKQNDLHEVVMDLSQPEKSLIQVLRLQVLGTAPQGRLVEVEVETLGDNLALNLDQKGGRVDIIVEVLGGERDVIPLGNAMELADGLLNTSWLYGRASRGVNDIDARITLDLGAMYQVDLVRLVSAVVLFQQYGSRFFDFKFYEVLTADGSLAPNGTLLWQKHFSGTSTPLNYRQGLADHSFALTPARYVRIAWKYWDAACAVALGGGQSATTEGCAAGGITEEIQVFGEGYPLEVRMTSPLIDLGGSKKVDVLNWQASTPPGTEVQIRSRSGDDLKEQIIFRDKNGKEITQKKWEKLISSFRGPVDTTEVIGEGWSPWSRIYAHSGSAFLSPSPRQYLELEARLTTQNPQAAASLDWLSVAYSQPLADKVVGEVWPAQVQPGAWTDFAYYLRAQGSTAGFDQVVLQTSVPLRFGSARLAGTEVEAVVDSGGGGLRVQLPRTVRRGELVELRFGGAVYLDATRVEAFVADSRQQGRQQVEAGDADQQVDSQTDIVRLPVGEGLLANIALGSAVLTPNGDGINDQVHLGFDLVNVLEARPLRLRLFDLSGRLVRRVEALGAAGVQQLQWDGTDARGARVPPGIYLLHLEVQGDARSENISRVVQVVY